MVCLRLAQSWKSERLRHSQQNSEAHVKPNRVHVASHLHGIKYTEGLIDEGNTQESRSADHHRHWTTPPLQENSDGSGEQDENLPQDLSPHSRGRCVKFCRKPQ